MNKEVKEAVLQAVDYTNMEAEKYNRRVRLCNGLAALGILIYIFVKDIPSYEVLADIAQGFSLGMLFTGLVFSSRYGAKIRAFKKRVKAKVRG